MYLPASLSPERALLAGALYVSAAATGAAAWLHAKAAGGFALFMCGTSPDAHCWACYAAPALAAAGVLILALPERARAAARAQ